LGELGLLRLRVVYLIAKHVCLVARHIERGDAVEQLVQRTVAEAALATRPE